MRLVVVNERVTPRMRIKRVLRDYRQVLNLHPTFVLWQELTRWKAYVRALYQTFTAKNGWVHYFTSRKNPISVRKTDRHSDEKWTVLEVKWHRLTRGRKWIPQPTRLTCVVIVQNTRTLAIVALVNSHFTNGGFMRMALARIKGRSQEDVAARLKLWHHQHADTTGIVADLYARGISMIGGGDYNRVRFVPFHPGTNRVVSSGLMHAWTLEAPGGARIQVEDTAVVRGLKTDHDGLLVEALIHPPKRGADRRA